MFPVKDSYLYKETNFEPPRTNFPNKTTHRCQVGKVRCIASSAKYTELAKRWLQGVQCLLVSRRAAKLRILSKAIGKVEKYAGCQMKGLEPIKWMNPQSLWAWVCSNWQLHKNLSLFMKLIEERPLRTWIPRNISPPIVSIIGPQTNDQVEKRLPNPWIPAEAID